MSLKAKIEAVLYMTDKPLRAQAIAGIVGEDLQMVRQALLDLIHEYEERSGGLEISDENGYSFQVKDEYSSLMDEFLPIEMSAAQLRTLSAIAIKQPISQSEIIRVRGAGAYEHIKELVQKGFISKREDEKGRSPLLTTTKFFQEYFRLTKDGKSLRQYLKRELKKKEKEDITGQEAEMQIEALNPEFSASPEIQSKPPLIEASSSKPEIALASTRDGTEQPLVEASPTAVESPDLQIEDQEISSLDLAPPAEMISFEPDGKKIDMNGSEPDQESEESSTCKNNSSEANEFAGDLSNTASELIDAGSLDNIG